MDQKKVGRLLAALRTDLGMTQQQLGAQLGVSNKTVSKWETGMGCPDVSILPDVARILGVRVEHLLSGQLPEQPPEEEV